MKDKLRQLLALILALSICFSLLSANVWATDEPEDVPTESTEVVTEKDKSEEKQEEAPAETQNENKQEEAPAETQSENKQEETPAETPSENKQEETPAETQSENKQEETPAEAQSEDKQEETPAETQSEKKQEEAPAEAQSEEKQEETPAETQSEVKQEETPTETQPQPMKKKAMGKMPGMSLTAQAASTTVTWNNNDITGRWGDSFSKVGVTITAGSIDFEDKNFMNGGTFTTTLGNFTKIEVTTNGSVSSVSGTGWSGDSRKKTWTGNASSVSFGGTIMGRGRGVTMVFTIETPSVAVTGVTLNPSAAQTIDVDGTVSFTATVLPDNATDKTVKWSVGGTDAGAVKLYSNEACTTEVGADATDKLTVYAKGISVGSATITATSNADSSKSASCDVTVNTPALDPVPYMAWNGTTLVEKTGDDACTDYTVFTADTTTFEDGKWYVVSNSVTVSSRITVTGTANLILRDGATLTASKGITVNSGNTINIYAQSAGTGELNAGSDTSVASIGGGARYQSGGTVNIHGGKITATGGSNASGIGGALDGGNGEVNIYSGEVTARGKNFAAGIGGYSGKSGGTVNIYGGTVNASGSQYGTTGIGIGGIKPGSCVVHIYGGEVTATSEKAAAGIQGTVTVDGGTVTANGGVIDGIDAYSGETYSSNGINGTVTVNGGTVTAFGGNVTGRDYAGAIENYGGTIYACSGIGGTVTISGGTVVATGGNVTGDINSSGGNIYVCNGISGIVTINGGTVTTIGGNHTGNSRGTTVKEKGFGGGLTLGTGMYLYGGTSANPESDLSNYRAGAGDYTGDRYVYMTVNNVVPHIHSFTYTATGATITAACTAGCDITEGLALTIIAPTELTYDGSAKAATLSTGYNTTAFPGEYMIKYYKGANVVEAANVKAAGDYTAKVTVGEATASVEFTIAKATPSIETIPTASAVTYGQKLADSTLTGGTGSVAGGFAWKDSTVAPAVSDSQNTEYDVVFTPTDENYDAAECKVKLTVNKADSAVTTAPTAKTLTYNGSAQSLINAGTASGGTMKYAVTTANQEPAAEAYTFDNTSLPTSTNAGTYYVWYKVVGDSNHNDTTPAKVPVTIAQAAVTFTWPDEAASTFVYDGTEKSITATAVTVNNDSLTLSYENNVKTDKGDYTAKVTGISGDKAANYVLNANEPTASHGWKITQAENTITTLTMDGWTYGGTSNTPSATSSFGADTISYTYSDEENGTYTDTVPTAAGTHYVKATVEATENYKGATKVQSFTINRATLTVNAIAQSKTYGDSDPTLTYTVNGLVGNDQVAGALSRESGESVNTYAIQQGTLTAGDNYNIQFTGANLTINKASITITADDKSTAYKNDLAELTFTNSALVEGDSVDSLKITATTTATKDSPKGEYPITLTMGEDSNPNYNVTLVPGTYTINEADATITASAYTGTYDGQEHSITVEVKDEPHNVLDLIAALFGADDKAEATVYYSTESVEKAQEEKNTTNPVFKDVGTYTVYYAVEFGGNYKADPVTGSQTVTITKAPLTVTAKDKTISYGEAPANDGVKYDGFAEGEDEKVLTGELSYAYNYKQGDNSGEYTITPSGLTSENYEITFVAGKLTVKALGEAAITVTTEGDDSRLDIELDQESAEKLLTEDELKDYNNGVSATVYVLVDELSASDVPAADKKLAEEFMKDGKIGQYLDLTLWVKVGNRDARQITNAASDITLKIAIPEKLQSKDAERTFYLIRVHDGKAESLATTTGDTLEADSRLFSTYAIAYKDEKVKDDTKKDDTKKDDTKKDTTTKTKTNTSKTDTTKKSSGRSPKTGDAAMLGVWFSLAGASATGLGALTLGGKKHNHRNKRNYTGRRLNK